MRFEIKNIEPMGAARTTQKQKFVDPRARKYSDYKKVIYNDILAQLNGIYNPLDAAIGITIYFYVSIPASWPKYAKEAAPGTYCTTKPDTDNMAKGLLDALNGLLWVDDNRIVAMKVCKIYRNEPGIEFIYNPIGELSHGQAKRGEKEKSKQAAAREKAPGTRRNISKRL